MHRRDRIKFLTRLFNKILMGERMPEEWRRSVLIPIYKNKGDAQCCGNYRGIKLISHTMKIWERIIEARLRDKVEISKQQNGFMPEKGTKDDTFPLMSQTLFGNRKGPVELGNPNTCAKTKLCLILFYSGSRSSLL